MELKILINNNKTSENKIENNPDLSFWVEEGATKILFDCGLNSDFTTYANISQIDLANVTDIILSRGYSAHINGFSKLQSLYQEFENKDIKFDAKRVLAHPDVFKTEGVNFYHGENLNLSIEQVQKFFNLALSMTPKYITPKFVYLGEIPRRYTRNRQNVIPEETALAYKSPNGLIIFSGCSHCGIPEVIEYAKYATGEQRILTIVSGLYITDQNPDEIVRLCRYLQAHHIKKIYSYHCPNAAAKEILGKYIQIEDIDTGKTYSWN